MHSGGRELRLSTESASQRRFRQFLRVRYFEVLGDLLETNFVSIRRGIDATQPDLVPRTGGVVVLADEIYWQRIEVRLFRAGKSAVALLLTEEVSDVQVGDQDIVNAAKAFSLTGNP
jgi:hypothetical protein